MSDNSSLPENNGAVDVNLASEYALRVALQTMKERCVSLQQRLAIVEEENLTIKSKLCSSSESKSDLGDQTESEVLREKLNEVTKQKYQLTEHIAMVSTENRQLWSRLSQLTKDKNNIQKKGEDGESPTSSSCQKLIRSETFTQHSPNVLIRPKAINLSAATVDATGGKDFSMEDVSLKNFGDYLGDKYNGGERKGDRTPSPTTLNFGFLNDDTARTVDFASDLKSCSAGMNGMKLKLSKQQNELKAILSSIKDRKVISECDECRKRQQKPEMADKGLETDECVRDKQKDKFARTDYKQVDSYDGGSHHINILEQKRIADERDKVCPLCGKIYPSAVVFDNFREHVETHFVDEIELDPNSIETNFEFISHTVGNF